MGKVNRYLTVVRRYMRSLGFGIHSPFAYSFVRTVLREQNHYYAYKTISANRRTARAAMTAHIPQWRMLTRMRGGKLLRGGKPTMALLPIGAARLLFRIANYYNPNEILQIGTNYGFTASTLMLVSHSSRLSIFEPDEVRLSRAQILLYAYHHRISHFTSLEQTFEHYSSTKKNVPFILVDAVRSSSVRPTAELIRRTLHLDDDVTYESGQRAVFDDDNVPQDSSRGTISDNGSVGTDHEAVFDDDNIHQNSTHEAVLILFGVSHSASMRQLWGLCKSNRRWGMTFSNEHIAILIANPKLQPQDFTLWL